MTGESPRFCGACGAALPPAVNFCPSCGQPVSAPGSAPVSAPVSQPLGPPTWGIAPQPQPQPQPEWLEPAAVGQPSRRALPLLLVGLVLVALVAGGIVAWSVLGSGGDGRLGAYGDLGELPDPVTHAPAREWTWDDEVVQGALDVGGQTILGTEEGTVIALDDQGQEEWRAESAGYLAGSPSSHRDLVLLGEWEGGGVTALSVEDGRELWHTGGNLLYIEGDGIFVADETSVRRLDVATGKEEWRADADSATVLGSVVYVVDGGELRRLSADDGKESWSVPLEVGEDDWATLTAVDGFVVATGSTSARAFDAKDGAELWSEDSSADSVSVGRLSSDRVYFAQTSWSDDSEESRGDVGAYDRDGRVGSTRSVTDYFYGIAFEHQGDSYLLAGTTLYDQDLETLATYDGSMGLAAGGIYSLDSGGKLAYYRLGEATPQWTLETSASESSYVIAGDRRVLVVADGQLSSYR